MPTIARVTLVFAGACITGHYLPALSASAVLCTLLALPLVLLSPRQETPTLVALALLGTGLGALQADRTARLCTGFPDRSAIRMRGHLETVPSEDRRTVTLRVLSGPTGPHLPGACNTVRARLPDDAPALRMGDAVESSGRWMTLRIGARPEPRDGMLLVEHITRSAETPPHRLLALRGRAQARIRALFPAAYPLAEALLVAQRENIDPAVREEFAASGLTHLLAISGTHVALVAAALHTIARLLRLTGAAASVVALAGSAAYVLFLGAPYAALRALIQLALVLASRSLQRPAHPLGMLAAAALAITALDAAAPLDIGFQLSFAGITGIVLWRRPLIELQPASLPVPLRDAIATTIAATAATTPIAAFHFGVVSVVSLPANLAAIPVVTLAVPAAAAALALSAVSMEAARLVAAGGELTLFWLAHIARTCAGVPGGHFTSTPVAIVAAASAALLARHTLRLRTRATLAGRAAIAVLAGVLPIVIVPALPLTHGPLEIHMIDVGQGDALAIRSPRGRWILVDAGPVSQNFDAGRRIVVPYLLRHQAGTLEAAILSHPHLDHFGGLPAVARAIRLRAILDPGLAVASPPFDAVLAMAHALHIPWLAARPGGTLEFDGVRIQFLGPRTAPVDASVDPNEYSAVFRLSYGRFSALFLGDLPAGEERRIVADFGDLLDVDLLKVAHHGSHGSSSEELLVAATPQVALIPAGRRNRYGHPGARVVARLEGAGVKVLRTDLDGSVRVSVDAGGGMQVRVAQ